MKKISIVAFSLLFLGVSSNFGSSYEGGDLIISFSKNDPLVKMSEIISLMAKDVGGESFEVPIPDQGLYEGLLLLKNLFDQGEFFDQAFVNNLSQEEFLNVVWALDAFHIVPFSEFESESNIYLDMIMPRLIEFYVQDDHLVEQINENEDVVLSYEDQSVPVQHRLLHKINNPQFAVSFKRVLFSEYFGGNVNQVSIENQMLLWDFVFDQIELSNLNPRIAGISYKILFERGAPYVTYGAQGTVVLNCTQLPLWVNFEGVEISESVKITLNDNELLQHWTLDSFCNNALNVKNLRVSGKDLTALPDSVGNLQNLVKLVLFDNRLIALPDSIGNLNKLFKLDVRNNSLELLPDSIGNLGGLRLFYLSENKLEILPESIKNLTKLITLDLTNNLFSQEYLNNLRKLFLNNPNVKIIW